MLIGQVVEAKALSARPRKINAVMASANALALTTYVVVQVIVERPDRDVTLLRLGSVVATAVMPCQGEKLGAANKRTRCYESKNLGNLTS